MKIEVSYQDWGKFSTKERIHFAQSLHEGLSTLFPGHVFWVHPARAGSSHGIVYNCDQWDDVSEIDELQLAIFDAIYVVMAEMTW